MHLKHTSPFTLKNLLKEVLLDIRCISITLMTFAKILFFIKHFYQPLRQLLIAFIFIDTKASITTSFIQRVSPRFSRIFLKLLFILKVVLHVFYEWGLLWQLQSHWNVLSLMLVINFDCSFHSGIDWAFVAEDTSLEKSNFKLIILVF